MFTSDALSQATPSRRELLRIGLGSVGALAMASTHDSRAREVSTDKGYIDAHVHIWTPDVERYPLAPGYRHQDMQPRSFTPDELFAHCRPQSVQRIVLIQMSFYGFDNSYMLDMMRKHSGVFSGVAVIDENDQPRETMKALAKQGVRGFRIEPPGRGANDWLAGEPMKSMWRCGADEGLAMCHLINPNFLPLLDQMCRQFPDTPVVIDHFARIGMDGMIRKKDVDNLCGLAHYKNVSVKFSAYYALGKKMPPYQDLGPMIRRVLDAYGPERLMWASDCPFQVAENHTYKPSIDLIRVGLDFLSANDRQWILRRTAEQRFFS